MNTSKLKKFAQATRRKLIGLVSNRLDYLLKTDSAELRGMENQIGDVQKLIQETSREELIEKVAYTWFNRFMALRFMDVNDYHTFRVRVVSPVEGNSQPEILEQAKAGSVDDELKLDRRALDSEISAGEDNKALRRLIVAVCNRYFDVMPFMFERVSDYTELLMPEDLLSESSVVAEVVEAMGSEECQDVEVIGWLYQFYISERHDEVMAGMKSKKKITEANIPAATQLFTPHWIVQYMVDNTLGKLWMKNRPNSGIRQQMEFYIHSDQEEDFVKLNSPEDIKLCDPACGSGHILVYAFDLLVKIYEEEGYDSNEIPGLILQKNLYGIDVDDRAASLASFALVMKGQSAYRRFLRKDRVQPNVLSMQNVVFEEGELDDYIKEVGVNLISMGLKKTLKQFGQAKNFGSLIKPEIWDIESLKLELASKRFDEKMFSNAYDTHQKVMAVMEQLPYLGKRFNVLVANPPYMNSSGMNPALANFVKDNYADYKSDLFSACIIRFLDMTVDKAELGFMSPFVWMFISSYEKLRMRFIEQKTITSLIQLEYSGFEGATVPICTFILKNQTCNEKYQGSYIKLSDFKGAKNQAPKTLEAIRNHECGWFYRVNQKDFTKIPGAPVAYWASKDLLGIFANSKVINDIGNPSQALVTGDTEYYIRKWHEVSISRIGFGFDSRDEARKSRKKWFPYNKGGEYRNWYGNFDHVVNWENDGHEMQTKLHPNGKRIWAHNFVLDSIFKEAIVWSKITSGKPCFRYSPKGFMFDDASGVCTFQEGWRELLLSILCSKINAQTQKIINPTLNIQPANIGCIPLPESSDVTKIIDVTNDILKISKDDWDNYESSWNYKSSPLIRIHSDGTTLSSAYISLLNRYSHTTNELKCLIEENNRLISNAYEVKKTSKYEVLHDDITINCNPYYSYGSNKSEEELESLLLADTMRDLLSYSVGCMLGRYSLDKPGLILANQGETLQDYLQQIPNPTFLPDDDNIIPIVDGDYFTDDIVARFKEFLRVSFGPEHYQENLKFIEDALGKDLRKYFLKDFYKDHIKRYKKRPIYWMFSSSKGSFNCLIYMHRYRPDTVSRMVSNYLQEFIHKLGGQVQALNDTKVSATSSASAITKADKEIDKIKKMLKELQEYERDIMLPLAQQKIEIDLDDGVKQNYPKFGKALAKVTGLS